uniref:PHF7/G2E3-like PHD zinc finger domain-containing protein n=1 Tax=Strix occidentalis caurina TaxID=311401 RepID=A0A8D0F0S0_STROC
MVLRSEESNQVLSGSHPDSSGFSSSSVSSTRKHGRVGKTTRCSFPLAFALSPPACVLCGRAAADPDLCGHKLEKQGLCAHLFCLVSLFQQRNKELGLMGFLPEDIRRTVERAAQKSYHTMAACAGIFFQCPLCRDRDEFLPEMLTMGIRIPLRLVSSLIERHRRCDARECLFPRGRDHEPLYFPRPWQLLLCSSCAATGTHRRCSSLLQEGWGHCSGLSCPEPGGRACDLPTSPYSLQ